MTNHNLIAEARAAGSDISRLCSDSIDCVLLRRLADALEAQ